MICRSFKRPVAGSKQRLLQVSAQPMHSNNAFNLSENFPFDAPHQIIGTPMP
jgi:hypothetical protein